LASNWLSTEQQVFSWYSPSGNIFKKTAVTWWPSSLRRSKLTVESMPPDSPTAIFMVKHIILCCTGPPYEGVYYNHGGVRSGV